MVIPMGRKLVGYSTEDLHTNFLKGDIETASIATIVSTSEKTSQTIAIGEVQTMDSKRKFKDPRVVVYDSKKGERKVLSHRHLGEREIEILGICLTTKVPCYCFTLTRVEKKEVHIGYYIWTKEHLIMSKQISPEVRKISLNPLNETELIACGNKYLRYYNIKEGTMKESLKLGHSEEHTNDFSDVRFFPGTSAAVAISTKVAAYVLHSRSVKCKLSLANSAAPPCQLKVQDSAGRRNGVEENEEPVPQCLAVAEGYFAVGWKFKGRVDVYKVNMNEEIEVIPFRKYYLGDRLYDVCSLEFNKGGDTLGIIGRRYPTDYNGKEKRIAEHLLINEGFLLNFTQEPGSTCIREIVEKGNPYGEITDISIATLSHIVATVGSDHHIRIWTYFNSKVRQSFGFLFELQLMALALHPVGHQLAVGSKEGFKIFYITEKKIVPAMDVRGKVCMVLQYSNGGHWLAAGYDQQVCLVDPNRLEVKFVLGSHIGAVTHIEWTHNDSYLSSGCSKGSVFVWSSNFEIHTAKGQRQLLARSSEGHSLADSKYEYVNKEIKVNGIAYDSEYDLLVIIRADQIMEVRCEKSKKLYMEYAFELGVVPTCVLLSKENGVLLVGTSIGTIRVFLWPMVKVSEGNLEHHDYAICIKAITHIKIVGNIVVVAAKDNALMLSLERVEEQNLRQLAEGNRHRKSVEEENTRLRLHEPMDHLKYLMKAAVESEESRIEQIGKVIKGFEILYSEQESNKRKEAQAEIHHLKEEHENKLRKMHREYAKLKKQCEERVKKAESSKLELIEQWKQKVQEQSKHNKINREINVDLYNQKIEALKDQRSEFEDKISAIQGSLGEGLKRIESAYQAKYENLKAQHAEALDQAKDHGREFESQLKCCEEKCEDQISKAKQEFYLELKKLLGDNELLKQNTERTEASLNASLKQMEEVKADRRAEQEKNERMKEYRKQLEESIRILKAELAQHELILYNREKESKGLKSRNQYLSNSKHILGNKIESLSTENVPIEEQVKRLETKAREMDKELEKETAIARELLASQRTDQLKLENADVQIRNKAEKISKIKRKIELLQYDMINLLKEPVSTWTSSFPKVYAAYFDSDVLSVPESLVIKREDQLVKKTKETKETMEVAGELVSQRERLASDLKMAAQENASRSREKAGLIRKLQKQNIDLIANTNNQRGHFEQLKLKVIKLEEKFKEITGMSLANAKDIEHEIANLLNSSYSESASQHTAKPLKPESKASSYKGTELKSARLAELHVNLHTNCRRSLLSCMGRVVRAIRLCCRL